jgi:hypothetical protein
VNALAAMSNSPFAQPNTLAGNQFLILAGIGSQGDKLGSRSPAAPPIDHAFAPSQFWISSARMSKAAYLVRLVGESRV